MARSLSGGAAAMLLLLGLMALPAAAEEASCAAAPDACPPPELDELDAPDLLDAEELSVQLMQQSLLMSRKRSGAPSDRGADLGAVDRRDPDARGALAVAADGHVEVVQVKAKAQEPAPTPEPPHKRRVATAKQVLLAKRLAEAKAIAQQRAADRLAEARALQAQRRAELRAFEAESRVAQLQAAARRAERHGRQVPSAEETDSASHSTWVKLALVIFCSLLFFLLSAVCYRDSNQDTSTLSELTGTMARQVSHEREAEVNCGGCCPCRVREEVDPKHLENWEVGGKEIFKDCPRWMHLPRDLGPRQWTWRVAEVNLWIQIVLSCVTTYNTYLMPRAVLKELQLAFALLLTLASLSVAYWVHLRAVVPMLQYFFCVLLTKALYMGARYAVLSGVVSSCAMMQSSFRGCAEAALRSAEIAICMPANSCTQEMLEGHGCGAPGVDTCRSIELYMPASRHGFTIFTDDVLDLLFFLLGTVPIFMAATAREGRKELEADSPGLARDEAPLKGGLAVPGQADMLPGR